VARSPIGAEGSRARRRRASVGAALSAALGLSVALLPAATGWAGPACAAPPGFTPAGRLESGDLVVLFRTVPAAVEIGRHFAVEAVVCPGPPATELRVDAQMPEHGHGMNYRPGLTRGADGVYRAEGLLFHMPGRWQLLFSVERGDRTERLATDIMLE
jgi:hypothetical protein